MNRRRSTSRTIFMMLFSMISFALLLTIGINEVQAVPMDAKETEQIKKVAITFYENAYDEYAEALSFDTVKPSEVGFMEYLAALHQLSSE